MKTRLASFLLFGITLFFDVFPAKSNEGSADELGDAMEINVKDAIKPFINFHGELQGAGTTNQTGIGVFLPLSASSNSIWFLDALVSANIKDRGQSSLGTTGDSLQNDGYGTIGDTLVSGTTLAASTRLGYRWLNKDRSWMYGINGGHDARRIATGATTNDLPANNPKTVLFQQIAINAEAKSNKWGVNAYGLFPVGTYGYGTGSVARINSSFGASPLTTVGIDVVHNMLPNLSASGGIYYQSGEREADMYEIFPNGTGFRGRLIHAISNQVQAEIVYTKDTHFDARISAGFKMSFGNNSKKSHQSPALLKQLTATPENRNVRVANTRVICEQHELALISEGGMCVLQPKASQGSSSSSGSSSGSSPSAGSGSSSSPSAGSGSSSSPSGGSGSGLPS